MRLGVASLLAATVAADTTYVTIGQGFNVDIPTVMEGSCCGAYDIAAYIAASKADNAKLIGIDTSCDYGSQPTIKAAIAASGLPREAFFITSKINVESAVTDDDAGFMKNVTDQILTPLGVTYVDLLLLHHAGRQVTDPYPHPACFDASAAGPAGNGTYYKCRLGAYKGMMAAYKAGMTRSVGVSNWDVRDIVQLQQATGLTPAVNQIENHPYWHDINLKEFCKANGIIVEGYAPIGDYPRSKVLNDTAVQTLATKYAVTPGQLLLQYEFQTGVDVVLPRSKTTAHMVASRAVSTTFAGKPISAADIQKLDSLPLVKVYGTQCQPWC